MSILGIKIALKQAQNNTKAGGKNMSRSEHLMQQTTLEQAQNNNLGSNTALKTTYKNLGCETTI